MAEGIAVAADDDESEVRAGWMLQGTGRGAREGHGGSCAGACRRWRENRVRDRQGRGGIGERGMGMQGAEHNQHHTVQPNRPWLGRMYTPQQTTLVHSVASSSIVDYAAVSAHLWTQGRATPSVLARTRARTHTRDTQHTSVLRSPGAHGGESGVTATATARARAYQPQRPS